MACACRRGNKSSAADAAADAGARGPTSTEADRRAALAIASASVAPAGVPADAARVDSVVEGRWPIFAVRANDTDAWLVFDRETEPVASAMAIATLLGTAPAFEKTYFASNDARFAAGRPPPAKDLDAGGAGANVTGMLLWTPRPGTEVQIAKAFEIDPRVAAEYLATRYLTGRGAAPLFQNARGKLVDAQYGDAFTQLASGAAHPVWRRLGKDSVSPEFLKRLLALDEGALASLHDARGNAIECGVVRRHLVMQRRHELLSANCSVDAERRYLSHATPIMLSEPKVGMCR